MIGATASLTHKVERRDTASEWGNELEVLATPVLLWLTEIACMQVLEPYLKAGQMSLGYGHDSKHLAPTLLGTTVTVQATLTHQSDKIYRFEVQAVDRETVILQGRHERAVVTRDRFIERLDALALS